jgi:hypothetical protein
VFARLPRATLVIFGAAGVVVAFAATVVSAGSGKPGSAGPLQRSSGWTPPELLAPVSPTASVGAPQIVIDGRGVATAVWTVSTESGTTGAEAERRVARRWSNPRPLPGMPHGVAVNARGDKLITWSNGFPDRPRVTMSYRRYGGRWQRWVFPFPKPENARVPEVALDARGGVLAVCSIYQGDGYSIEAAAPPPGGRWQRPKVIETGFSGAAVTMVPNEDALLVWLQSCGNVAPSPSQCAPGGTGNPVVRLAARSARGVWSRAANALGSR